MIVSCNFDLLLMYGSYLLGKRGKYNKCEPQSAEIYWIFKTDEKKRSKKRSDLKRISYILETSTCFLTTFASSHQNMPKKCVSNIVNCTHISPTHRQYNKYKDNLCILYIVDRLQFSTYEYVSFQNIFEF